MELKHIKFIRGSNIKRSINRTFMELKRRVVDVGSINSDVLIEPLWN